MESKESIKREIYKQVRRQVRENIDRQVKDQIPDASRYSCELIYSQSERELWKTWNQTGEREQQIKNVIANQIIEDIKNGKKRIYKTGNL